MAVPIIIFYLFGIIFFILALEAESGSRKDEVFQNNERQNPSDLIYAGVSIFLNLVAYYISYSQADYVTLAYIPEAFVVMSVLLLIYRVYNYLPKGTNAWGEDEEYGKNKYQEHD